MISIVKSNELALKIGAQGNLDFNSSNTTWDEAGYGKVNQILISYSADAINSIQMVYELNRKEVLADQHGGEGNFFESIRFDPGQCITSISGHFGSTPLNPVVVIKSLRFSTVSHPTSYPFKTASYGPFGCENGTPFRFESNDSQCSLCGFHGSSSSTHLTSIGVYLAVPKVKYSLQISSSDQSGGLPLLRSIYLPALPPPSDQDD